MARYKPKQMQKAAKFILKNNPYSDVNGWTVSHIKDVMRGCMEDMLFHGNQHCSTMGFVINFYSDVFDISVDPAMSDEDFNEEEFV